MCMYGVHDTFVCMVCVYDAYVYIMCHACIGNVCHACVSVYVYAALQTLQRVQYEPLECEKMLELLLSILRPQGLVR